MDEDLHPRCTPPPRPVMTQIPVTKPTVPEVSLLFDSDDSLIWTPHAHLRNRVNSVQPGSARVNRVKTAIAQTKTDITGHSTDQNGGSAPQTQSQERQSSPATSSEPMVYNLHHDGQAPSATGQREFVGAMHLKSGIPWAQANAPKPSSPPVVYNPLTYSGNTVKHCPVPDGPSTVAAYKEPHVNAWSPSILKQRQQPAAQSPTGIASSDRAVRFSGMDNIFQSRAEELKLPDHIKRLVNGVQEGKENLPVSEPQPFMLKKKRLLAEPTNSPKTSEVNYNAAYDHFYKLLESQNKQICQLQKFVEKLITAQHNEPVKQWSTRGESLECTNSPAGGCSCTRKPTTEQKIAIVQTDPQLSRPQMVSAGTNTDISWGDLLKLPKGDHRRRQSTNNRTVCEKTNNCHHKQIADDGDNDLCSTDSEDLFTLQDIIVATVHDQPSPEPSIHVHVPDYQEDSCCSDDEAIPTGSPRHLFRCCNAPVDFRRGSPMPSNVPTNLPPCSPQFKNPDENNGMTFYNNVMINIQQILQGSGNESDQVNSEPQSPVLVHRARGRQATNSIKAHSEEDPQIAMLHNQFQKFGISFLDPESFTEPKRPVDTFYMPGIQTMLSAYQAANHIKAHPYNIVNLVRDGTAAKYVTDAQLAAIAAASPVACGGLPQQLVEACPNAQQLILSQRNPNDLSAATQKFLRKYGLE